MIEAFAEHDGPEGFGALLKRRREERQIALEDIAAYTRIKLRALEAIERDDFAALPPLAFIRAFIRCYADYIGLDVADVMAQFDVFIQDRYPDLTGEVTIIQKRDLTPPQTKWTFLFFAAIIAFVFIGLAIIWRSHSPIANPDAKQLASNQTNSNPNPETAAASPEQPAANPDAAPAGAAWKEPPPWTGTPYKSRVGPPTELILAAAPLEPLPATPGPTRTVGDITVNVKLKTGQKCTIDYRIDDKGKEMKKLGDGEAADFKAAGRLTLTVYNPDAVDSIALNGKTLSCRKQAPPWELAFDSPDSPPANCVRP